MRVVYGGQPASDTGGVSRHFFSDVLHRLSEIYFSGESRKIPLHNIDILVSGLMKIIGTIIVHSVLNAVLDSHSFLQHYIGTLQREVWMQPYSNCALTTMQIPTRMLCLR